MARKGRENQPPPESWPRPATWSESSRPVFSTPETSRMGATFERSSQHSHSSSHIDIHLPDNNYSKPWERSPTADENLFVHGIPASSSLSPDDPNHRSSLALVCQLSNRLRRAWSCTTSNAPWSTTISSQGSHLDSKRPRLYRGAAKSDRY